MSDQSSLGNGELVGVAEVAKLAGVTSAAVANWRARGTKGFPAPIHEGMSGPVYRLADILAWLAARSARGSHGQPLLGIETSLWAAADKLRGSVDPSQYRHMVLTLLFLRRCLVSGAPPPGLTIPSQLSWKRSIETANSEALADAIESVIDALEAHNPRLAGVLPRVFARSAVDGRRLRGLVKIVSNIADDAEDSRDQLGRAYEYFLGRFAALEGRSGGEFYTPSSVVRLMAEIVEPLNGKLYDPCCGSGGMFVQSARVRDTHGSSRGQLKIYGQELNPGTWRLAQMNLALHDLAGNLGEASADTFHEDIHADLKADYILANPPFNISDWGVETLQLDRRWEFGLPPPGNANLAWVQHIWSHLSERGRAGIVLSNGSLSNDSPLECAIRSGLITADAVECVVSLPSQLFYSTTIPVTLWFLAKDKSAADRQGHVLFIDARAMGEKVTRSHRELTVEDIARVVQCYRAWRNGEPGAEEAGFSAVVKTDEIAHAAWSLVPSRYVGSAGEDEAFGETIEQLLVEYRALHAEATQLDDTILRNFEGVST